jgi:hypothetical protein
VNDSVEIDESQRMKLKKGALIQRIKVAESLKMLLRCTFYAVFREVEIRLKIDL